MSRLVGRARVTISSSSGGTGEAPRGADLPFSLEVDVVGVEIGGRGSVRKDVKGRRLEVELTSVRVEVSLVLLDVALVEGYLASD